MKYNFIEIENKWQHFWEKNKTFSVKQDSSKPKFYVLDMFPYPSGSGLHVGHPLGYIASDIYARYKILNGYNVLHPMGYDSFGLPTEQYAIETGIHPAKATAVNTRRYDKQLKKMGFAYDWDRKILTSDSSFYRWTQWIFRRLYDSFYSLKEDKAMSISNLIDEFKLNGFSKDFAFSSSKIYPFTNIEWMNFSDSEKENILQKFRLAFLTETTVNWCEELGTVLANDEVKDGFSERGGYPVIKRKMKQWALRITAYSNRLLEDLNKIDWPSSIKEIQKNWIGKSTGASIFFKIDEKDNASIEVYTTRPDTIFGVTFLVLSPEHPIIEEFIESKHVSAYVKECKQKTEIERKKSKLITGVFSDMYALHPITNKKIPIWISDYVLIDYGTGAIMAVPCGDQRDWSFANKFDLEIKNIFEGVDISKSSHEEKEIILKDSDFVNGLSSNEASQKIVSFLESKKLGFSRINFKQRDAIFSRQRYWGEPFPVYYEDDTPKIFPDNETPTLPEIDEYKPTKEGLPPLARAKKEDWNVFRGDRLDYNVMPGWAGSSWYFIRFIDPKNDKIFCDAKKLNYWNQVDLYIGGAEHAVGHLMYSRFWTKFLFDIQKIPFDEPFKKLINQGMILGRSNFVYKLKNKNTFVSFDLKNNYDCIKLYVDINLVKNDILNVESFRSTKNEYKDSRFILNEKQQYVCGFEVEKMSKSKYNTQTPDELILKYGADTLRLYEMFLGPLEQYKPWDTNGITGVHNFLKKLWDLVHDDKNCFLVSNDQPSDEELNIIHLTINKINEDLKRFSFNTIVSSMMICLNKLRDLKCNKRSIVKDFTILLSPFAPHIAEEIWQKLGNKTSVAFAKMPDYDPNKILKKNIQYPISFNGKTRFKLDFSTDSDKDYIQKCVLENEKTAHYLSGKSPKKIIIVPGKIVNIVF